MCDMHIINFDACAWTDNAALGLDLLSDKSRRLFRHLDVHAAYMYVERRALDTDRSYLLNPARSRYFDSRFDPVMWY